MDVIKPLIKQKLTAKKLLYKPCVIIMGRTGAGKTTLVNSLCGTQHVAGEGKGSVTRNLYLNDVGCGENIFSLIDTPGTDSASETLKHAILLREGLTATKINTIFIVIKYDSRFDKMTENYFEVEQPVYNYTSKVVVMISHWDQSKNPQKNYEEICELFQDECPTVTNLIFYSERSSKSGIANLMYRCMSNMNNDQLKIGDEEFFLKFNIYEMKSQMKISFKEYQKKTSLLIQEYTELINSTQRASVEERDEILHMAIVQFKNELEVLLQEFQQKHGGAMIELDYYVFSIKMQKENVKICDDFVERVVPLMSYNLFDNEDPRNLIKRCPSCGIIWFKTEGCDGTTTCGNNQFSKPAGVTSKVFWKYYLQRIGGKLQWTKNPIENNVLEENLQASSSISRLFRSMALDTSERRDYANSKRVGCGKEFRWSTLPKIEDELILELFKVKTIDQAKQLIQADNFKEARQNYESTIDSKFHF
jgi:small GTP-binding protein